jgi:superfamily I DNA/RNA helicase
LQELQDRGIAPRDISILVRTNRESALVANYLLNFAAEHPNDGYCYDIISEDALLIGAAPSVRALVALLRFVKNPCPVTEAFVRYALRQLNASPLPLPSPFPTDLYRCVESLYRLYTPCFPEGDQAFVQAFFDAAMDFVKKDGADIGRFLQWWEEHGQGKPISLPEGQEAIRVLTVHKSKGLGLRVVLLPLADWEIDHRPTHPLTLWCRPRQAPFDRLQLVPVRYGKGLADTRFAADYFREKLYAYIDSLNTLYVACTRACEELILLTPRFERQPFSIGYMLVESLSARETEEGVFEVGGSGRPADRKATAEAGTAVRSPFLSVPVGDKLRVRLHREPLPAGDPRGRGILLHDILSGIETRADVE